jgi:hypothetical protein
MNEQFNQKVCGSIVKVKSEQIENFDSDMDET